jgi:hypothetical protein
MRVPKFSDDWRQGLNILAAKSIGVMVRLINLMDGYERILSTVATHKTRLLRVDLMLSELIDK